jgi:DNA-binding Lrp family transcriptional regulator
MVPLKPADVAVALQLSLTPDAPYRALAEAVGISHGEAHNAVRRLQAARLLRAGSRVVKTEALLEFLLGGVPYVFAATPGAEVRGVPTAHAAPPLGVDFTGTDAYVWPSAEGRVRGAALEPLYAGAVHTATTNPALYELLGLVDALRAGRARERQRARDYLRQRLGAAA